MGEEVRVVDLWNEVDRGGGADHPSYKVVVSLNTDDGPDEQILEVRGFSWDHDMGYFKVEV